MFKNIKAKNFILNKNFILIILGLLIINLFAYFPNSKVFALLSKTQTPSANTSVFITRNSMIRDYKIPDIMNSKEFFELIWNDIFCDKKSRDQRLYFFSSFQQPGAVVRRNMSIHLVLSYPEH